MISLITVKFYEIFTFYYQNFPVLYAKNLIKQYTFEYLKIIFIVRENTILIQIKNRTFVLVLLIVLVENFEVLRLTVFMLQQNNRIRFFFFFFNRVCRKLCRFYAF